MKTAAAVVQGAHQQFVALVAHELRNPLLPIKKAAALLKQESLDAATIRRAAEIIERQVSDMNRLIGDLLDVSRLQMGGLEMRMAHAPLSELMERVVETAAPVANERGHDLLISMSPEPVYLNMDVLRMGQALHNIIGDASKHGHITVSARREDAQVIIVVSDVSLDASAAENALIFELEPGVAVGLYLARYLVEAHSGTVTVANSGPGLGRVFTVRLPCGLPIALPGERPGAEPAVDLIRA